MPLKWLGQDLSLPLAAMPKALTLRAASNSKKKHLFSNVFLESYPRMRSQIEITKKIKRNQSNSSPLGVAYGFFFSLMPNKNRTTLKGLTSSSYRIRISAKETTAMITNFGRMPIFQRITNQPTQRMIV